MTPAVQPYWAALPLDDRGRYLRRAAQVVLDVADELVPFLGHAHGRSSSDAWSLELLPGVDVLHWAAGAGARALASRRVRARTPLARGRRARVVRGPLGLVAVRPSRRAPWAWPLEHAGIALMAGNAVVLAPGPGSERMARVWERAGVPEGLVTVGGEEVLAGADLLLDDAAEGRDAPGPMLVLGDADVERAARAAAWAGRADVPAGVDRLIVAHEVAEPLGRALAARRAELPLETVAGEAEALACAAEGPPGGGASVWSENRPRAARIARALAAPLVWVNDHASPIRPRSRLAFERVTRPALVLGPGLSPWWGPADAALPPALAATGALLYGREADRLPALRAGARPLLRLATRALRTPS